MIITSITSHNEIQTCTSPMRWAEIISKDKHFGSRMHLHQSSLEREGLRDCHLIEGSEGIAYDLLKSLMFLTKPQEETLHLVNRVFEILL